MSLDIILIDHWIVQINRLREIDRIIMIELIGIKRNHYLPKNNVNSLIILDIEQIIEMHIISDTMKW